MSEAINDFDEDDEDLGLEHVQKCPKCSEGEMFRDPDDEEEPWLIFCDTCGYVIDPKAREANFIFEES